MGMKTRRGTQKNPPIFSHEFIIQNHADIVSCFAMIFVVGLMFQVTAPVASMFVAVNHNASLDQPDAYPSSYGQILYTYGLKDLSCVFFYFLICIIVQAVVQEYVIDKINRKLHLSKVNHRKFNESGQLIFFYLLSVGWGLNLVFKEGLLADPTGIWTNYPETHAKMTFQHKFFFIIQIAYWLHQFPELYFLKAKKDEVSQKIRFSLEYLIPITTAYLFNYTKLALVSLILHYSIETVAHFGRILYFAGKNAVAKKVFMARNALYVPIRVATIVLSVLTFYFGLPKEQQGFDVATGNFNTPVVRTSCLVSLCLLQALLLWSFVTYHLKKRRERAQAAQTQQKKQKSKPSKKQTKVPAPASGGESDDVSELPEVDQNTSKDLRQRKVPAK